MNRRLVLACSVSIAVSVFVTACNPEASENANKVAVAPANKQATEEPLPTQPTPSTPGVVVPGILSACDPASVGTVRWSFDHVKPSLKLVDVYVGGSSAESEKLFVTGPTRSESTTGPWIRPGTTFVFKNHDDSSELYRLVVKGPNCGI